MKKSLIVIAMLAAAGAASAQATDYANVRRVTAQHSMVPVDREVCETRNVTTPAAAGSSIGAGTVIGGIAGGLLGAQVGKGNGRVAAAAVGAGVGALVGNSMERQNAPAAVATTQPVRECRIVTTNEQRVSGYLVEYDYHGRAYSAVLPSDPGPTLRVNVSVTPAL